MEMNKKQTFIMTVVTFVIFLGVAGLLLGNLTSKNDVVYVILTIDTEQDLPPYLDTYVGIEEGIPKIVTLLDKYDARATFLVTGDVALRYPGVIESLSKKGHEIGSHGMYHENFNNLNFTEKFGVIRNSTLVIKNVTGKDVTSFRAPYHSSGTELVNILEENGYLVEASAHPQSHYPYFPSKDDWLKEGSSKILRIPVSLTPAYFYPTSFYTSSWVEGYQKVVENQKDKPIKVVVIGMHPWEFVPIEYEGQETYTRTSGDYTFNQFDNFLNYLKEENVKFVTLTEFYTLFMENDGYSKTQALP
ncbi:MAG: polysaccharide deacetylase family protein [Candidatus Aenigmarchaeota archaeon]|nr:polysaccharide deacetylase family protein [Candidatus Aenigmarchaeota archaeon]